MIKERTKIISLHFKRAQLLYDIKNYAYVEGDTMRTDNDHNRHQIMDIGEEGNVDRVTRILDLGIAHCTEVLYPYSRIPVMESERSEPLNTMAGEYDMITDDTLTETNEYVISLLVPDDFSETSITYLERLIHELLICWVLSDWLSIVNSDSAAKWAAKMDGLEDTIRATMSKRCGRIRKFQSSF